MSRLRESEFHRATVRFNVRIRYSLPIRVSNSEQKITTEGINHPGISRYNKLLARREDFPAVVVLICVEGRVVHLQDVEKNGRKEQWMKDN